MVGLGAQGEESLGTNDRGGKFSEPGIDSRGLHGFWEDDVASGEFVSELMSVVKVWLGRGTRREVGEIVLGFFFGEGGVMATVLSDRLVERGGEFGRVGTAGARVNRLDS